MARAGDGNGYGWTTAASSGLFELKGGLYMISAVATWGGGNIELKMLGPDGSTLLSLPTALKLTANGTISGELAAGQYEWVVTTATNGNATIRRVPND